VVLLSSAYDPDHLAAAPAVLASIVVQTKMLRFRTTAACVRGGAGQRQALACRVDARPCARLEVPCQQLLQSKVGTRNSIPALQAHRGDEVAAFLVAGDTQQEAGRQGTVGQAAQHADAVAWCVCCRTAAVSSSMHCLLLPSQVVCEDDIHVLDRIQHLLLLTGISKRHQASSLPLSEAHCCC
jgi:hypothetical protein